MGGCTATITNGLVFPPQVFTSLDDSVSGTYAWVSWEMWSACSAFPSVNLAASTSSERRRSRDCHGDIDGSELKVDKEHCTTTGTTSANEEIESCPIQVYEEGTTSVNFLSRLSSGQLRVLYPHVGGTCTGSHRARHNSQGIT